jgi:DNA-binding NarL/FixJ family response regulator
MILYTIIHSQFLVHYGIKELLSKHKDYTFKCKNYFFSTQEALVNLQSDDTKIIFFELQADNDENIKLVEHLRKKMKQAYILLMGAEIRADSARRCLIKGAQGFVYDHATENEFLEALDIIISNNVALPLGFRIHPNLHDTRSQPRIPHKLDFELTSREKEILVHISNGLNNKEISTLLFISDQTVAVHRKNLFRKMGVKNSISLVKVAKERRMIA